MVNNQGLSKAFRLLIANFYLKCNVIIFSIIGNALFNRFEGFSKYLKNTISSTKTINDYIDPMSC